MRVSLNWLRELVQTSADAKAIGDRLTMGGLELDGVEQRGAELRDVVIAEIVSISPHPQADRLSLCDVRTGAGPTVTIVCGATNMKAGDRVPYAPPGATLPDGRRIEARGVRGVTSAGMLCSAAELQLGADAHGLLILDRDAPLGTRVGMHLGLEDTILEISVPPNRGDCLSILGVARELAALGGAQLLRLRIAVRERGLPAADAIAVAIEEGSGCARYAARLVRKVRIAPSPGWMQARLETAGVRPINNVVDATNYVMLERGQPLHAFDYDRLPRRDIIVRRAGATAAIETLDGTERVLAPDDILITTGAEPIAVAGVMGGASTEVSDGTTTVLLESAWFDPRSVRRTARRLGLHSESSYRFERGVDVGGVLSAIDRAAGLLEAHAGGQVARGVVDVHPAAAPQPAIMVRVDRVGGLIGAPIDRSEITGALKRLGVQATSGPRGMLMVVPPTYRHDLSREADIIEEVARVLGYHRVPPTLPTMAVTAGEMPVRMRWTRELQRLLTARGLFEAVTHSFTSPRANALFAGVNVAGDALRLTNPMSREEPELRRSLLGGLVELVRFNRSHGSRDVAVFTVGKVFWSADGPQEAWRVAAGLAGTVAEHRLGSGRPVAFADAKGIVEGIVERLGVDEQVGWRRGAAATFHPGQSATVLCDGDVVGVLGTLHPDLDGELEMTGSEWFIELDLEKLLAYVPARRSYRELPRFPAIVRDIAIVSDTEFASDEVSHFIRQWGHALVEGVVLFDEYVGAPIPPGRKSLAYSVRYRAPDRTLTDDEVNNVHAQLTAALRGALPVELRG